MQSSEATALKALSVEPLVGVLVALEMRVEPQLTVGIFVQQDPGDRILLLLLTVAVLWRRWRPLCGR